MRWIVLALAFVGLAAAPEQVRVSGTIETVRESGLDGCELCQACHDCRGVHLALRARSGRIEVHLAPAWFLDRLEFTPAAGDLLTIDGIRMRMPAGRGLAAYELHTGSTVIKLRDTNGLPLWRQLFTDAWAAGGRSAGREP